MTKIKIKIDVVSDINCPWCYLGEARLQQALTQANDQYESDISFKPYELNPLAPQEGESKQEYFIRNYGEQALARLESSSRHLMETGRAEGVFFNFSKSDKVHNTFNGHRLIWLAGHYGVQVAIAKALFEANFTNGANVNDLAVLISIGIQHGIPAERLQNFFRSDEGKAEVKALEQWAQQAGISGVPAFIINDKYLISGAQPAETLVRAFQQIHPAEHSMANNGVSCDVSGDCSD